jgi:hypothetical protein
MRKFKEGDKVKVIGRNATLNRKIKYGDVRTVTNTMSDLVQLDGIDDGWLEHISVELAEDTSKPVTATHEGNVYEIGKYYLFSDNGNEWALSRLVCINSQNSFKFESDRSVWNLIKETKGSIGTITTAPIELIDGNAYMFNVRDNTFLGFYRESRKSFFYEIENGNKIAGASECTNIRPMTVTESK